MIIYLAYAAILITATAFVAYWCGVAAEQKANRRRAHMVRATRARLHQLEAAIIEAERRLACQREGAELSAAEIDAWHELVAHEDEAA